MVFPCGAQRTGRKAVFLRWSSELTIFLSSGNVSQCFLSPFVVIHQLVVCLFGFVGEASLPRACVGVSKASEIEGRRLDGGRGINVQERFHVSVLQSERNKRRETNECQDTKIRKEICMIM